jgi:asparagine synthase (glutamine-hydrolysing)
MRLIGGLAFWNPAQQASSADLQAMTTRVPGIEQTNISTHGSIGFFSTMEPDISLPRRTVEQLNASTPRKAGLSTRCRPADLPTCRPAERFLVVADLDLTNLPELQALTGLHSDGDSLIRALYEREGPRFVRRLRGAFALALWDRRKRTLLLAVDRFGFRRLYHTTEQHRTAFASRTGPILGAPEVEKRVDLTTVYSYLNFDFVPAPQSIFTGIRRLPPGHLLVLQNGNGNSEPYWDMTYPERSIGKAKGASTLYRLMEEAVADGLRGIHPKEVGAFLSGGTDSSTVVGFLTRLTGERVNAFSIGFHEERYDELDYAKLTARHFGAVHHTQIISPEETLELLPRLVEAYDEPFGNNSAIGTFFCAKLARDRGFTTLLAGDGGDEIFGGNERYRTDRIFGLYHWIPAPFRRRLLEPILFNLPNGHGSLIGRAQRYIRRANIRNPQRFFSYEFFVAQEARQLLSPDFLASISTGAPYVIIQTHYDHARATAELNRLLYLDLKLTIGDNDLLKVTRTAELAGVNVRFPLLHPPLVEFTGAWPAHFKVRGLERRFLFKRAFQTFLPPETLAKRKHGFGVPTSVWLKNHPGFRALARDTLLSSRALQRGYFQPGAMEKLFEWHEADATPFYGDLLWTMLMLELWHRRHLDRDLAI